MSVPTIAFFNNKGGVGKTTLVYHFSHMAAQLGYRILAADLDPQTNLTAVCMSDDELEALWESATDGATIYGALRPIVRGLGDVETPIVRQVAQNFALLPGDNALSRFEDKLSSAWTGCLEKSNEAAFRTASALWRAMQRAAESHRADLIAIDLGPNLGSLNRTTLISSDFVLMPLGPDVFSLQGLKNLGPALREWRQEWSERRPRCEEKNLPLPVGSMTPLGYIVMQHSLRADRPAAAYERWISRMPRGYATAVLDKEPTATDANADPHCLVRLKHYRSLMPMAQDAHKPIFMLTTADGAVGGHIASVRKAFEDFKSLTLKILAKAGVPPVECGSSA